MTEQSKISYLTQFFRSHWQLLLMAGHADVLAEWGLPAGERGFEFYVPM